MPLNLDYDALLPAALRAMYPDPSQRSAVEGKLEAYEKESYHVEQPRVRLGILYLVSQQPEKLDQYIELACTDYRDLLCAAEYPHSSREWRLSETDSDQYKMLQDKETSEYMAWVGRIKRA